MKRKFLMAVLVICVVAVFVHGLVVPKFSLMTKIKTAVLSRHIREEIAKLGNHEWAGEYYEGDGLAENVRILIAPKHGYVFEWHGCLGLYDRNYGRVTPTNGHLRLSFTFTNKHEGFEGIADELIPIRWGERTYLVPTSDVVGFCNEVNGGSEPRNQIHGRYLLRRGDETKSATNNPTLPAEFQVYLLQRPVMATITRTGKTITRPGDPDFKLKDTMVTINAGVQHGLHPEMELYVTEPDFLVEKVKLMNVTDGESEGVITQFGEGDPVPQVGWKLSTRAPWKTESDSKAAK